jgi:hypothetical protein
MVSQKFNSISLIEEVTGIKETKAHKVTELLRVPGSEEKELISKLAQYVVENSDDWWGVRTQKEIYSHGVYSPLQLLVYYSAKNENSYLEYDFPFLFGTIGNLLSILLTKNHNISYPDSQIYRKDLQTIFQLRETKEEGENLSLETYLYREENPKGIKTYKRMELKKLSQLFGRGVGIVSSEHFQDRMHVKDGVIDYFQNHDHTPSSILYTLAKPYESIPKFAISISLRRDRSVSIAVPNNPILEFYDGGWHVTDLASGVNALNYCLDKVKSSTVFAEHLLSLAYHMASHWHSGILAVVDTDKTDKEALEKEKEWSLDSSNIVKDLLKGKGHEERINLNDIHKSGLGRLLLTHAIQDGATIFSLNGDFHSSGRIVKGFKKAKLPDPKLGTGNRAAMTLAKYGVALKISKDGAIRLYSGMADNKYFKEGLRIR